MNKEQKAAVVDQVAAQIEEADAVFAVDYRGISVPQAAELRTRLGDAGATFRIVKNTLTERAADKAGADALKELLEGPTAFTFVSGDAAMAAKALADLQRETQLLEFKGGILEGATLTIDEIKSISRLPARDVLQGQFVAVLASPLTGLVRGLAALISGLAVQLKQIEEQGLIGGDASAATEETTAPEAAETDESAADEPAPEETAGDEPAPDAPPEETITESRGPDDTPAAEAEPEADAGEAPTEAEAGHPEGQEPDTDQADETPTGDTTDEKEG